jgi:hypothetical protein
VAIRRSEPAPDRLKRGALDALGRRDPNRWISARHPVALPDDEPAIGTLGQRRQRKLASAIETSLDRFARTPS